MAEKVKDTQTHSFVGIRTILLGLVGLAVLTAIGISSMSMYFLATQKKDAPVINIAGRQRMLSQKMSKEVLMVAASSNASAAKEQLRDTKILFDRSLKALIDGDSDMGLPATSEGPIHEQLLVVKSIWEQFSPKIQQILTHTTDTVEFQNALKHILSDPDSTRKCNRWIDPQKYLIGCFVPKAFSGAIVDFIHNGFNFSVGNI